VIYEFINRNEVLTKRRTVRKLYFNKLYPALHPAVELFMCHQLLYEAFAVPFSKEVKKVSLFARRLCASSGFHRRDKDL